MVKIQKKSETSHIPTEIREESSFSCNICEVVSLCLFSLLALWRVECHLTIWGINQQNKTSVSQCVYIFFSILQNIVAMGRVHKPDFLEIVDMPLDNGYVLIQPCVVCCREPTVTSKLLRVTSTITDKLCTEGSWLSVEQKKWHALTT